ncbi:MAG TPA: hypothetical protein VKA15_07620 [Isosphaeraceae bacterium]|nr:hypothetical protein [Isosphaeraceae bacterium]
MLAARAGATAVISVSETAKLVATSVAPMKPVPVMDTLVPLLSGPSSARSQGGGHRRLLKVDEPHNTSANHHTSTNHNIAPVPAVT